MRTAFIQTLLKVAEEDNRIWLLAGDLGYSVLEPFAERFPDRYINAGVAEQNMIGVAAGLALSGKVVFVYSIANFPTLRCLEQIRNDVCAHNLSVKIVSIGGGFAYGTHGYSHHGIEDLAILRTLPNMEIAAPADPVEVRLITRMLAANAGPGYLRLGRGREPTLHQPEPTLTRGQPVKIRPGSKVAILSTGGMLETCLDAAEKVKSAGLTPAIYSVPWIKPMDAAFISSLAGRYSTLITVEEARITGGLGGAVAEIVAGLPAPRARLKRLGVPDEILEGAYDRDAARKKVGIDTDAIVAALRDAS